MAIARRNNFEGSKPKLKNCVVCGKIFASVWGSNTCDRCRAQIAEKEKEVIEYVMEHPNETIPIVAEECEVSVQFVRKMIESGRLTIKGEDMSYPCKGCGKPIVAGQYCVDCMARIQSQIEKAKETIKKHWQDESGNDKKDRVRAKKESRIGSDSVMPTRAPTLRETMMASSTYKTMMGISDGDSKSSKKSSKSSKSSRASSRTSTRQGRKVTMPPIPPMHSSITDTTILGQISNSIFSKFISGSKNQSDVK